jgi:predicted Zn-dependent protease
VLDQAKNEGEVAGVLAHEISHVSLRHGTHQASKAYAAQAGLSILGGILGGKVGQNTAQILNVVGGVGLNALFLKYSRDLESQADVRGAQILAASGYSPADMVSFFQTLESVDKSKKTNWLSDHPAPPDRISRIQKEASLLRVSQTPTTNVAELRQIQGELRSRGNADRAGNHDGDEHGPNAIRESQRHADGQRPRSVDVASHVHGPVGRVSPLLSVELAGVHGRKHRCDDRAAGRSR